MMPEYKVLQHPSAGVYRVLWRWNDDEISKHIVLFMLFGNKFKIMRYRQGYYNLDTHPDKKTALRLFLKYKYFNRFNTGKILQHENRVLIQAAIKKHAQELKPKNYKRPIKWIEEEIFDPTSGCEPERG